VNVDRADFNTVLVAIVEIFVVGLVTWLEIKLVFRLVAWLMLVGVFVDAMVGLVVEPVRRLVVVWTEVLGALVIGKSVEIFPVVGTVSWLLVVGLVKVGLVVRLVVGVSVASVIVTGLLIPGLIIAGDVVVRIVIVELIVPELVIIMFIEAAF
jgi:hypothetical protein